jgi:hypothetical protein
MPQDASPATPAPAQTPPAQGGLFDTIDKAVGGAVRGYVGDTATEQTNPDGSRNGGWSNLDKGIGAAMRGWIGQGALEPSDAPSSPPPVVGQDRVGDLRNGGFSEDEISQWSRATRQRLEQGGFSDAEINAYLTGVKTQPGPSVGLARRVYNGVTGAMGKIQDLNIVSEMGDEATAAWESMKKDLIASNPILDPKAPFWDRQKQVFDATLATGKLPWDAFQLAMSPVSGAFDVLAKGVSATTGAFVTPEEVNTALLAFQARGALKAGRKPASVSPLPPTAERVEGGAVDGTQTTPIGALPQAQDYPAASRVLNSGPAAPSTTGKLLTLYEDHGIHPAEVVHDASTDPVVSQQMLSKGDDLPSAYVGAPPPPIEPLPEGHPFTMTPGELDTAIAEKGMSDQQKLVQAFGEDGAKDFRRLDRQRNSLDLDVADRASAEFDEHFGNLTPEQERLAYGIGETDAQVEDLKALREAREPLTDAHPDEIGRVLTRGMLDAAPDEIRRFMQTGEGDGRVQAAAARIETAMQEFQRRNIPTADAVASAAKAMQARGFSPEDASEVLRDFRKANAPPIEPERLAESASAQFPYGKLISDIDAGHVAPRVGDVAEHLGVTEAEAAQHLEAISRRPDSPIEIARGKFSGRPEDMRWRLKPADRREAVMRQHDNWAYKEFGISRADFGKDSDFIDALQARVEQARHENLGPIRAAGQSMGFRLSDAEARDADWLVSQGADMENAIAEAVERSGMLHEQRLARGAAEDENAPPDLTRYKYGLPAPRPRGAAPAAGERAAGPDGRGEAGSAAASGELARAGGGAGGRQPPGPPAGRPGAEAVEPPRSGSLEAAQQKILDKISVGEKAPGRRWTWGRFYTAFVDKYYPIAQAVQEAQRKVGPLTTAQDPYRLVRLFSGQAGRADHFIRFGTFDFKTLANTGPSLQEILRPFRDNLDGLRAFATSARALELEKRGIASGFDMDAARQVVKAGVDTYAPTLAKLIKYQNELTRYLRDSGVLSREGYAAMLDANKLYVPFSRIMGDEVAQGFRGGSLTPRNPIKAITGSQREIVDPIETIIRNTYTMTTMADRNAAVSSLVDMLKKAAEGETYTRPLMPAETEAAADSMARDLDARPIRDVDGAMLPPPEGRLPPPKPVEGEIIAKPPEQLPSVRDDAFDRALTGYLKERGIDAPEDLIAVIRTAAAAPAGEGEIRMFRDGKPETYKVDADLARAVKGLDAQTMGMLERIASSITNIKRAGAVLNPAFAGRHIARDYLYAFTTYKNGVFNPIDMVRGIAGLVGKDADFQAWEKGGGANISVAAIDRRYLQNSLESLTGSGLRQRAWNVVASPDATMGERLGAVARLPYDVARHPVRGIQQLLIDPLRALTELAENASHLGAYKKAMRATEAASPELAAGKESIQSAAWTSRDVAVDAARMGSQMRAWNAITAFANITIQDTDRVVRAIKDNPGSALVKIAAGVTLPSVLLWLHNHDDSRYQELPQWEKDLFWVFPLNKWEPAQPGDASVRPPDQVRQGTDGRLYVNNGTILRIAKPWGMGLVFGSLPERLLSGFADHDPDAYRKLGESFSQVSVPSLIPDIMQPLIEQFANRSTFNNRTIVPGYAEKLLPEYQYTPYTTELTKLVGRTVGAFPGVNSLKTDSGFMGGVARSVTSPAILENYIRSWTGSLGTELLGLADASLRQSGIIPDPPQPAKTLADLPIIRAFVVRYPGGDTKSISAFEDAYQRNKIYFDTIQAKAKEGDAEAVQAVTAAGGPQVLVRLDGIQQTISNLTSMIRKISMDPQVPALEKRQIIDTLYFQELQTAQAGIEAYRQVETALRPPKE